MALPPKHSYQFIEGDTLRIVLRYKDSDGVGINLTTSTLKLEIKDSEGNTVLDLTGSVTSPNYEVTFTASAANTVGLAGSRGVTRYSYDVQRTYNSGTVDTILHGYMFFYNEVTD